MEDKKELTPKAKAYIEENFKNANSDTRESHKRFDYLLVSVASAGIYTILELMKYMREQQMCVDAWLKMYGGFLFVSILSNILSQFCTFNVNYNVLKIEQAVAFDKSEKLNLFQTKLKVYSFLSNLFMWICTILFFCGVIGLMIFIFQTF